MDKMEVTYMATEPVSIDVTRLLNIPTGLIKNELEGLYGSAVLDETCGNI